MRRSLLLVPLALTVAGGVACHRSLNPRDFSTSTALYSAGVTAFEKRKWNDAINAFERLTLDLPTRDTLLPRSHWYLGQARLRNRERLLAAQAFTRLAESFPDDTLADRSMYMAGHSYALSWRRPQLDPQYAILAQTQYRLLTSVYPTSPWADSARRQLRRLDEMFAAKDYQTALHYIRRKAYDSAVIYLRDVIENWPNTDQARLAMLRLVEVYRLPAMNYREDAEEVCAALRAGFPTDPEVLQLCKASPGEAVVAGGR